MRFWERLLTQSIRDTFAARTKAALHQFVSDRVSDRLKLALAHEEESKSLTQQADEAVASAEAPLQPTEEELQAYYMVMAILAQVLDPQRVTIRDHKSYCSVLLDDSNRKPICRLWFNGNQKYVGVFDEAKVETRMAISSLAKIYELSSLLKDSAARYEVRSSSTEPRDQP